MLYNERRILDILAQEPMISQNELADRLNISRSSVSVYISNLIQEGYILGRGYVLNQFDTIYSIGAANVDFSTYVTQENIDHFNSGAILTDYSFEFNYGGNAKSAAYNLTRLGCSAASIFAVGDDTLGNDIIKHCKENGINVEDVIVTSNHKTAVYFELLDRDTKKVRLSSLTTELPFLISPEYITSKLSKLNHAKAIIVDATLRQDTLQLISSRSPRVFLNLIQGKRISLVRPFLNQFAGIFTSLENMAILYPELSEIKDRDKQEYISQTLSLLYQEAKCPILLYCEDNQFAYCDKEEKLLCEFKNLKLKKFTEPHSFNLMGAILTLDQLEGYSASTLLKDASACFTICSIDNQTSISGLCREWMETVIQETRFKFIKL